LARKYIHHLIAQTHSLLLLCPFCLFTPFSTNRVFLRRLPFKLVRFKIRLVFTPTFCGCLVRRYNLLTLATKLILLLLLTIPMNEWQEHHDVTSDDTFQLTLLFCVKVELLLPLINCGLTMLFMPFKLQ